LLFLPVSDERPPAPNNTGHNLLSTIANKDAAIESHASSIQRAFPVNCECRADVWGLGRKIGAVATDPPAWLPLPRKQGCCGAAHVVVDFLAFWPWATSVGAYSPSRWDETKDIVQKIRDKVSLKTTAWITTAGAPPLIQAPPHPGLALLLEKRGQPPQLH